MPVFNEREDLRKSKTRRALYASLSSLLGSHRFEKITVINICEEALISRATFYAYFLDKYDLLKYWLMDLWTKNTDIDNSYGLMESSVNEFIHENESVLKNLVSDADNETLGILYEFILSTLNLAYDSKSVDPKSVILSNFYAGGMVQYLLWQVKNRFPEDVPPMNKHLYEIIGKFKEWNSEGE